jgi:O-antigen biosynthesis protein
MSASSTTTSTSSLKTSDTPDSLRTGALPRKSGSARVSANSKFFFQSGEKYFVKGVTYGPFPPRKDQASSETIQLPELSRVRQDLDQMRQGGINTVRLYHNPPRWFLDECDANKIKAFITLPWEQHISFLDSSKLRRSIRERTVQAVTANKDHPAIFAYAVGNEIPAPIARWYGPYKVESFIESLVDSARQIDPKVLYTYANYPTTEYLLPGSVDFYCYNVYLHRQQDFERYLARLQNLAGEKPLMLGECGMDTMRHSEEEQAELFRWHIQSVARMGLAGTVLFAWTDEWYTGGHLIEDWKFGLVDAQRKPKKAYFEVQKLFKDTHRVPLPRYPSVSVVVCSYNGAPTLDACLTSLQQLDYPDYEIILVDDGSTDRTPEIAKDFPNVKTIRQKNMGLSYARNVGMKAARGEVIAYTDSDCMADKDWLYYLIGTLEQGDFVAVGGPNISPPAQSWSQACVAASPGQPSHVLITDQEAEHIPGCNMAYYKWALEAISGFDPEYRKAGDDVDVCWRLMQQGYRIGFSAAAIVWHHRRFTIRAYFKQQAGYGEAEALLRFKHFVYFGPTGSAKWRGCVYGPTHFSALFRRPVIYHGVFGYGLFQCIYPRQSSDFVQLMGSLEWNALTLVTLLLAIQFPATWYVPAILLLCTVAVGLTYGFRARVENPYQGFLSHLLVSGLAILQPIERGWARYSTWMSKKRTPGREISRTGESRQMKVIWDRPALLSFWNEKGKGREHFLKEFEKRLEEETWMYSSDTGWTNWDYQIYGNSWWQVRLLTVTEEHGDGKRLTRVRLHPSPTSFTRLVAIIVGIISLFAYIKFYQTTSPEGYNAIGVWFTSVSAWLAFLLVRSFQLSRRVAQVAELAAKDCELSPIHTKR